MIKLKDLLNEISKNKWTELSTKEVETFRKDLYNIIQIAYKPLGGHPGFKSQNDIPGNISLWHGIDLDDDPEIDATIGFKKKPAGTKMVVLGQDGTSKAKKSVILQLIKYLKKKGWYGELSKALIDKLGLTVIDDEATVRKVMVGKDIEWLGKGYYKRTILGKVMTKALVGNPK